MEYKISELAEKAGVTKRTIHYYISKGLLMPPKGSGVKSLYNDSHLEMLKLIKSLQSDYLPLNYIRDFISDGLMKANRTIQTSNKTEEKKYSPKSENKIYVRENVCNIFEMHYTQENGEKYRHILDSVKNYVEKMLED